MDCTRNALHHSTAVYFIEWSPFTEFVAWFFLIYNMCKCAVSLCSQPNRRKTPQHPSQRISHPNGKAPPMLGKKRKYPSMCIVVRWLLRSQHPMWSVWYHTTREWANAILHGTIPGSGREIQNAESDHTCPFTDNIMDSNEMGLVVWYRSI